MIDRLTRGSNQSALRAHNERLVLTLLRNRGALSKSQIAKMTGLSAQAAGVIMKHLETEGFLSRGKPRRGRVGQPSIPMSAAADAAYFFGLKIGRRVSEVALINFMGEPVRQLSQAHFCPTPNSTVAFAEEAASSIAADLEPAARERIAGLGVATPFQLWEWAEQTGAPEETIASWRHQDIGSRLSERFDWPIFVQNDASAACAAELAFGHPAERNFLYFFVGSLIGGGVVLNGSLFTGSLGNAGALGSMPVSRQDGERVQLIDIASIASLERAMAAEDISPSAIRDSVLHWRVPEEIMGRWIDDAGDAIAQAVLSACSVIDFETVIIEGSMPSDIRAKLTARIDSALSSLNHRGIDLPTIREGLVGANARVIGAASLPLFERFLLFPQSLAATNVTAS